jgi:hypothetical protein
MVEDLIDPESVDKLYELMEKIEGRQIRPRPHNPQNEAL